MAFGCLHYEVGSIFLSSVCVRAHTVQKACLHLSRLCIL